MPTYIESWIVASINGVYATRDAQANVFSFSASGPNPTIAELNDCADMLSDWVTTSYKPLVNGAIEFTNVHVRDASSDTGEVVDRALGYIGTNAGEALPANVTACASLRSAHGGRSGRGRMFAMTTSEVNQVAGAWVNGYADDLKLALETLLATATAAGLPMVVASRVHGQLWAIETVIVRPYVCSQIDRLPFHRRRRRTVTP